ncbi:Uncharacterised protein [Streptococcus pneumoniae]|uniref:Uncharacterized protein n=1 Tax=Streptococcus pneumoniae TaxID=1313 RepID=A0A4J2B244_STREE|nr:Uncharacterised protein [Streptococcus pneumoniae]VKR37307.1 Uncharacterised protein [Streptococcus pneumoniae]VKV79859.1 Uncharacterised protein [Streptococcus pneumoniae]VKY66592.1 Uncharacterised protein [Streptococcus pneumoniae]VLJ90102.1 Uncharacterised protein [Streptococcus pneumoniae]
MFTGRSNSSPFLGVGLIQFLRLTSSILFQGAGLKHPPNLLTVFIFSVRLKTSPGLTSSLLFKGTGLKTSTGCSNSSPFLGVGLIQSPRLPAFLISSAGLKTSPGRFYSSIKLLKTSSIMFHSSSESSGIGCNSPSVPSSFSMNE